MATQTHDAPTVPTTTRETPPGVRPPRTWGSVLRYIGIAVALIYALFPVVFIISAAFNPGGTLTTTSLIPKGASMVNFTDLCRIPWRMAHSDYARAPIPPARAHRVSSA